MKLVLDKEKAALLFEKIDEHCIWKKGIMVSKNKDVRYHWIARQIMNRYGYVILVDGSVKTYCNNPRSLKRWATRGIIRKDPPLTCPNCGQVKRKLKKNKQTL